MSMLSMRTLFATATAVAAILALSVAAALIVMTSWMRQSTAILGASLDSVRAAHEAQVALLLHSRIQDEVVRRGLEGHLTRNLKTAGAMVMTANERDVFLEAEARVFDYLEVARSGRRGAEIGPLLDVAYTSLTALVGINVDQSERAQRDAGETDELANIVGLGSGILVMSVSAALLWWLRVRAFQPIVAVSQGMERFGRGDRSARIAEVGPAELRTVAARFNEMAAAVAQQRQALLASLAGIAHDLRNPLSALRASVAIVRPDAPLPPEPQLRRMLEIVRRQIVRLDRMAGDFLDMARVEAGQLELRLQDSDLRELATEVVELFEASAANHALVLQQPEQPLPIRCDPLRIEQVISNLISNAIKYSPEGTHVDITLESRGGEAMLAVHDQGRGISAEDQSRLFEPFRRIRASHETIPGVGLGLFVVGRIVAAHRGRIEVSSELGRGAQFRVYLPLLAEAPEEIAGGDVDPSGRGEII
ncbi:MAG TPA: ATP-binding protein [Terriglobales bacterium]|nr:ATP-binding protein [Terriglobales bacterium]